jgi:hypothetical protein
MKTPGTTAKKNFKGTGGTQPRIVTFGDSAEPDRRREFLELYKQSPIPGSEVLMNLGLFLTPAALSRILFLDFPYRQIITTQGIVAKFGCRWGQNLCLLTALRNIHEPYNRLRKVVGFDTFTGLHGITSADSPSAMCKGGDYSVTPGYESYLRKILNSQENWGPLAHLKNHELVKGDACLEFGKYLKRNPETIVALAYFDMDIYQPTRKCLRAIRSRLTRGSIIGFDELNEHAVPGETLALKEILGLDKYAIRRVQWNTRASYLVID